MRNVHRWAVQSAAGAVAAGLLLASGSAQARPPGQIFSFEDAETVTVETPNAGTQTWAGGIANIQTAYQRTEGSLTRYDPTQGYIWGQSFGSDSGHSDGFMEHSRSTVGATDGSYSLHIRDPDGGFAWGTQVLFNDINDPRWQSLTTATKIMYEISTPGGPTPNGLPSYQVGFAALNFAAGFLDSYNPASVGNNYQFASAPASQTEFTTQTYIWDAGGQMIAAAGSNWPGLTEYVIFHINQNSEVPASPDPTIPADYYLDNFRALNESSSRPTWQTIATGDWTTAGNWNAAGVPNGVGAPAIFYGIGAGNGTVALNAGVNLNSAVTVGSIIFDAQVTSYQKIGASGTVTSPDQLPAIVNYTVSGSGSLTFDVASGDSEVFAVAGNHSINVPVTVNDSLRLDTTAGFNADSNSSLPGGGRFSSAPASGLAFGAAVNLAPGVTLRTSGGGFFAFNGAVNGAAATLRLNGGLVTIGDNVNVGTLVIAPAARVAMTTSGSRTIRTTSLTVGDGTIASSLNIANNGVIVDHAGGGAALAGLKALITAGRDGGTWTGPGISSSAAAADVNRYAIGYGEAGDVLGPSGGTFMGQSVDGTAALARFTLLGDANVDGGVNIADFSRLGANFNTAGDWAKGDFNYDGQVGIADFSLLGSNFNLTVPAGGARPGAVPEPATAAILIVAGALAARRRRG